MKIKGLQNGLPERLKRGLITIRRASWDRKIFYKQQQKRKFGLFTTHLYIKGFLTLFVELIEASLPQISRAATELGVPFSGCDLHCIAMSTTYWPDQLFSKIRCDTVIHWRADQMEDQTWRSCSRIHLATQRRRQSQAKNLLKSEFGTNFQK